MQLDPGLDALLAELSSRHDLMDMLARTVTADYNARGGAVQCAKGCSSCCNLVVNCTFAEALLIAESLDEQQSQSIDSYVKLLLERVPLAADLKEYLRMHRREMGGCPFLVRGVCGIYRARPVSCRSLLATLDSKWCGVDFSELSEDEKQRFMGSLDRTVTAFPMHYLAATQEVGAEMERLTTAQMARTFGFALYGNMPVLVHLISRHGIVDALAEGRERVEALVRAALPDNRFLVEIGVL